MEYTSENLKTILNDRLKKLKRIQKNKEKALKRAPEGKLRINNRKSGPQYYYRKYEKEKTGIYLPRKEIVFVRSLAQKDYDERILRAVQQEIKAIGKALLMLPEHSAEEIFSVMNLQRRELINPLELTDEMFVEEWIREEYVRKEPPEPEQGFLSDHDEIVRSKSEWIIANLLARYQVPYKYERPLYLDRMGIVHPDFTVLNIRERKVRYWEHEGMMDDPVYAEYAVRKERAYIMNGYMPGDQLILTSETKKQPLNTEVVKKMIEKYCL